MQQVQMNNHLKFEREKLEMRQDIKSQFRCLGMNCELEKSSLPDSWGIWKIRGLCDENGLKVEVRRYSKSGEPSRDPIKNKIMDWQSLFTGNEYICRYDKPAKGSDVLQPFNAPHLYQDPSSQMPQNMVPQGLNQKDLEKLFDQAGQLLKTICPEGTSLKGFDDNMQIKCE